MKNDIAISNLSKPAELKHNNDNYALVDDSQFRGGLRVVNNKTERNQIPLDKRGFGVVKYKNSADNSGKWISASFIGPDCTDSNWTNDIYWEPISNLYASVGVIDAISPVITLPGDGTITVPSSIVAIRSDIYGKEPLQAYTVAQATFTPIDNYVTNYVIVKLIGNTAFYDITVDKTVINNSNVFLVDCCWRLNSTVKLLDYGSNGNGQADKISSRIFETNKFKISSDSELKLVEIQTPVNFTITLTSAKVYAGQKPIDLDYFSSADVAASLIKLTVDIDGTINTDNLDSYDFENYNPYYVDNAGGGELVVDTDKYIWRRFYRAVSETADVYYIESPAQYDDYDTASESAKIGRTDTPSILKDYCIFVGYSVVKQGATQGKITQVLFNEVYESTGGGGLAILPIATETVLGGIKPDNTTLVVDPSTGVASVAASVINSTSVYVSSIATVGGNGSVQTPFQTIQEAITYMIGNGTAQNPQNIGNIIIDSGTYTMVQADNMAINGVNYILSNVDTIINYNGNCLNSSSTEIAGVNYSSLYIPAHVVLTTINTSQTTLANFIANDGNLANCKSGTKIVLGGGSSYLLMSDKRTVTSEYKPISGTISTEKYLFDYRVMTDNHAGCSVLGKGIINLLGTGGFTILANHNINKQIYIDVTVRTYTSLVPLFKNTYGHNSISLSGIINNGNLLNYNGTGVWHDTLVSNTTIISSKISSIVNGSDYMDYRGNTAILVFNSTGLKFDGQLGIVFCNYFFTLGSNSVGMTNNLGIFISGNLSGCTLYNKQSIGLLQTRSTFADNEKAGIYIQNLLVNKQLSQDEIDCVFGTSTEIFKLATNPINFIIQNSSFRNVFPTTLYTYLGKEKTNNVPSINRFGNSLLINNIPTATLPDNTYVIVVDANGVSQKVAVSEIKTPSVVVTDTKYTAQTTIPNYIANDAQAATTNKSNLVSLADGSLYVLTDTTPLIASAYKQVTAVVAWNSVTGKPSFASVATSGQYDDLAGKPNLSIYALVSDTDGGQTILLTANTDILDTIRTYVAGLSITDTTILKQRTIAIIVNGFTATFGSLTSTTDMNFRISCRLENGDIGAIGDLQIVDSNYVNPTLYQIAVTPTNYTVDRMAKYSEISGNVAKPYFYGWLNNSTTNTVTLPYVGSNAAWPALTNTPVIPNIYENLKSGFIAISNNNQITIPTTGIYKIAANITFGSSSGSSIAGFGVRTSAGVVIAQSATRLGTTVKPENLCFSVVNNLTQNTILEFFYFVESSSQTITLYNRPWQSNFQIELIS